ncbi:MAG: hypothetical protein IPP83_05270 [Flavobacteriales bacterium]|nr:hypothetical protein [Flavobacteriales bacterium]
MTHLRTIACSVALLLVVQAIAQKRTKEGDVSSTIKGDLVMPVSFRNPLFNSITETIGQVGATFQVPIRHGIGLGVGGNMSWFTLKQRALAPRIVSGDVRRLALYGKVQLERYTSERTFYELNLRVGMATYDFDCAICTGQQAPVLYWSLGTAWYIHATDNLAFGLLVGYDNQAAHFSAGDLGLNEFPGRKQTTEDHVYQNLLFGLGFSTRLRRSERDAMTW